MQARSMDGGETWRVVEMPGRTPGTRGLSADEHVLYDLSVAQALVEGNVNAPVRCTDDIDFMHPDFAMMCARSGLGVGTTSWFYVSYDRCLTWEGPYSFPMFGLPGIEARTDYLVSSRDECLVFLTAAKANGGEGGGVFCTRTVDGGKTFDFVSWVARSEDGFVIMPSSVRLSESRILVALRCRGHGGSPREVGNWIDLYESNDNGLTWAYVARPVSNTGTGGNPPAMLVLKDGRICLVYGFRDQPYEMRARLSSDTGITWGKEIVLRSGAGNHDLGYPRAVCRADGSVVAAYYFNDSPEGRDTSVPRSWKP